MNLPTLFTTLAALALTILAAPIESTEPTTPTNANSTDTAAASDWPRVYITNQCSFPLYVTSVGKYGPISPTSEISAGGGWAEAQYTTGVGTAIKLTRTHEGLYNGEPVLIVGYTINPGASIYYDLGLHGGNPLTGYSVRLSGAGGENFWNPNPKPQSTIGYMGQTDLTLVTCV